MPEILRRLGLRIVLPLALIWGGSLAVPASANPCTEDPGGIGGTGKPQMHEPGTGGTTSEGVGGTGKPRVNVPAADGARSEGIGGTGATAAEDGIGGTGVVGTITGFGSICVNGIEIHYDAQTPVVTDGKRIRSESLAIGQVVAVAAVGPRERDASAPHHRTA